MNNGKQDLYDVVGIGFGPAGIALAAALDDLAEQQGPDVAQPTALFYERAGEPSWQPGLMLRGTDIQHNFLRDFASPRDPRSKYTFLNYLKMSDRLFEFGEMRGKVSRIEWGDYVCWAARQLEDYARYNEAVRSVAFAGNGSVDGSIEVRTDKGGALARSLVVNTGPIPNIPEQFSSMAGGDPRCFHSVDFLNSIEALDRDAPLRFCLIGSGQSAAEIVAYLHATFKNSEIWSLHRGVPFPIVDIGHISNHVFYPSFADYFYSVPDQAKLELTRKIHSTNYSAIDMEVSAQIYTAMYEDKIQQKDRIRIIPYTTVHAVQKKGNKLSLDVRDIYSGDVATHPVDIVVLCTGYVEETVPSVLSDIAGELEFTETGKLAIQPDYSIALKNQRRTKIFLNGMTECSHGISNSTSWSMMALKAEIIRKSITERHNDGLALAASSAGTDPHHRPPVQDLALSGGAYRGK